MKKEFLIISLLLLVSLPAIYSLLVPGGFTSHDLTHHIVRQISMDKLLSEGQFPPRWSGELNEGFGYPVFLFNYPLPAMVGEIFHKLGWGFVDSVKAVLFSSMILSVLGMYLFLRSFLDSKAARLDSARLAAFLGAVFYLYAPVRFLNVYVSASVGSALALALVPFVFWSLSEIKKGKKWAVWVGSLSLAGVILAHNVTALIFAPVIMVFTWILVREVSPSTGSTLLTTGPLRVKEIGVMFLLGLGLSTWFWLPAVLEKQYTRFDLIFGNFYKDQFISLWQLIHSPWGYGLSHPQNPEPGDMSYQIGLIHILVMLVLVPLVWLRRKIGEITVIGGFVLAFFAISVFLMLGVSLPVWESLPFLPLVQFPLRFSAISVFSASIGAAILVKYLPFKKIVFVLLFGLVLYANRNHWHINEKFDPGENYYLNLKTTSTTYGEHLPKWGRIAKDRALSKLEFIRGAGKIRVIKDTSAKVLAEVETTASAKLRFNQFYFPLWQIEIDGKLVNFNYLTDGQSYGLPTFDIEKGSHKVEAEFKDTLTRSIADKVSMVSLIAWLFLSGKYVILKGSNANSKR